MQCRKTNKIVELLKFKKMETKNVNYKVRANRRERTLTIREYVNGKLSLKFRSIRLPKNEFNYYDNCATENDIRNFLKSSDYYIVKSY